MLWATDSDQERTKKMEGNNPGLHDSVWICHESNFILMFFFTSYSLTKSGFVAANGEIKLLLLTSLKGDVIELLWALNCALHRSELPFITTTNINSVTDQWASVQQTKTNSCWTPKFLLPLIYSKSVITEVGQHSDVVRTNWNWNWRLYARYFHCPSPA